MDASSGAGEGGYTRIQNALPNAQNQSATMPPLVSAIERLQRMANSLADLGDQLHAQASRVMGNNAVAPSSPQMPDGKVAVDAPLMSRLDDVIETMKRNLQRASAGASRLSEIG